MSIKSKVLPVYRYSIVGGGSETREHLVQVHCSIISTAPRLLRQTGKTSETLPEADTVCLYINSHLLTRYITYINYNVTCSLFTLT